MEKAKTSDESPLLLRAKRSIHVPKEELEEDQILFDDVKTHLTKSKQANLDGICLDSKESIQLLLQEMLHDAQGAQATNEADNRILTRVGRKTRTFVTNFSAFLDAYAGLIEIVKAADNQYGGAAYSALSLLLIVGVNKTKKEDVIKSTLLTLQREYSRLQIIQDVHDSNEMGQYIQEAFECGYRFAKEALRYYTLSRFRRSVEAVFKPPSLSTDKYAREIVEAVSNVNRERDVLNTQRLHKIEQDIKNVQSGLAKVEDAVENVKIAVDDVNDRVEEIQTHDTNVKLADVSRKILPIGLDIDKMLAEYKLYLEYTLQESKQVLPLDINDLLQSPTVRSWNDSGRSSILLLRGQTVVHFGDVCWISPTILHLHEKLRKHRYYVASYCCHTKPEEKRVPFRDVLCALLPQLLKADLFIVRAESEYAKLDSMLRGRDWNSNAEGPLKMLEYLFQAMSGTFYILIDRIDHISGEPWNILKKLSRLVQRAKCVVKILLIASADGSKYSQGRAGRDLASELTEELGDRVFHDLFLDQDDYDGHVEG